MKNIALLLLAASLFFSLETSAQAAFRHVTTAVNTAGHITTLDHPQLNGNPNAIVFVMPNYNTNGAAPTGADYQQNAGVWYNGSHWTIFNQNTASLIPINLTFNVLIAPSGNANYFTISCTAASKAGLAPNGMVIDHPATNNKPDALLLVTQNYADTYNDNSPIVSYSNGKWYISNNKYLLAPEISAKTTLPVGARFNVMVVENNSVPGFPNARAFMHTTITENIIPSGSSITFFDQPFLNGNTNAMIWATPNWGWSSGRNAAQTSGPYNDSPIKSWYDHPTDPWNYKNGYWSIYNSDGTILKPGTKFNILAMNVGEIPPQPPRDLTGFYQGDNGNCGQAYIRQIGNKVYWFGEHPNGSFGHVFSGTISGNTLTGNLWDVPKGTLMNKGNCVYNISADGNTLTLTGGNIGCNVLAKTTLPAALPASKPMQPGSGALTGVWDCNDGAATYVREDGNDFLFFSEAKNNGTRPGFANLYLGKRNGNTITGEWIDVPKGTHLGSGAMTLRVESDTRFVRTDGGNGYGGSAWTRSAPPSNNGDEELLINRIPNIQSTVATVYEHCNYQGQSHKLKIPALIYGSQPFTFKLADLKLPDNSISSIQLEPGYKASLLDDPDATGSVFVPISGSIPCLTSVVFNDKTSSIIIWREETLLTGWVDLHTHPMSHLGFGRKAMHGVPDLGCIVPAGTRDCNSNEYRASTIDQALGHCNSTHGGWGLDNTCGDYLRAGIINYALDSDFEHKVAWERNPHGDHEHAGYPDFRFWPNHTSILHQQMWIDWVRRAHQGGLRVMVALTVNSELLAEIINGDGPYDDKTVADLQIDETVRLVSQHPEFMEIAYTSKDVRRIVGSNRLAVILGMEVDKIGNFGKAGVATNEQTVRDEIHRLFYDKGIRYIFPIHLVDNSFGGSAVYQMLFNFANKHANGAHFKVTTSSDPNIAYRANLTQGPIGFENGLILGVRGFLEGLGEIPAPCFNDLFKCSPPPGKVRCCGSYERILNIMQPAAEFDTYKFVSGGHVNSLGLTSLGEFAILEMMKLGMIIDLDHMSERALIRTIELAESVAGGYPLNMGHNGIRGPEGNERGASAALVRRIAAMGGMMGVGTGKTDYQKFSEGFRKVWNVMGDHGIGIGTDVNGFEPLPGRASGKGNQTDSDNFYRSFFDQSLIKSKCQTGNRIWDYVKDGGVSHYGIMPEFLHEVKINGGADIIEKLNTSAEYFAQMWEKCERQKKRVP